MSALAAALPWHASLWRQVSQAIAQDRLGHALLLCGPAGVGKRQFARRLAAALWCRQVDAERNPCGHCEDCLQVASEAHSGYHLLRVPEDKRDIPIDDVRELTEKLQLTTHDGRAKVAIIEPVDALNTAGVNALLKTIEEPTPGSHLLLISERPMALLATLRSRCQALRFLSPADEVARDWLGAQVQGGEGEIVEALRAARGAPLLASSLIESGALARQRGWREAMTQLAGGGDPIAAAQAVGAPQPIRATQVQAFAEWLHGWLVELLTQIAGGEPPAAGVARALSQAESARREAYLNEVQEAPRRLAGNVSPVLVLESLAIGWAALLARSRRA